MRHRAQLITATFAAVLILAAAGNAFAAPLATIRVASGLSRPLFATSPPGDTSRVFIVEQHTGRIRILKDGAVLAQPFMTQGNLSTGNEQGLLGLAFHPQYPDSPYFYVNFTRANWATVIRRYSVSTTNPDSADTTTGMTLLTYSQPQDNHNGGWLGFGPDGYLYIASGDGGGADDDDAGHAFGEGNGQADSTRLGKILRIDVDGGTPYAIPPDNPFVGQGSPKDEFWAKGVRNPWRCSFDRLTGDFYIGDVGQNIIEEIDYQAANAPDAGGRNYGWRKFEGYNIFNCPNPCDSSGLTRPVSVYSHGGAQFRCSVTGGYVYRGEAIPQLQGHYIFADYCADSIWTIQVTNGVASPRQHRTADLAPGGGLSISDITSFGEDARGEIYICEQGTGGAGTGELFKIIPEVGSGIGFEPGASGLFLGAPAPNPSGKGFAFRVGLPATGRARLDVYDTSGRLVRSLVDGAQASGPHDLSWDARDARGRPVPGGVYILRLEMGEESRAQKVSVVR
jgi:glucose/arabinose dehydrogenase